MSDERYRGFFSEVYGWFGQLCTGEVSNSDEEVARFWTDDARMITNGMVESAGIAELKEHFDKFPAKYSGIRVHEPYHRYLEVGDTVVIEYEITGETKAGEDALVFGAEDGRQHIRVIAIFTMRDGRIAEMREVAAANLGDA